MAIAGAGSFLKGLTGSAVNLTFKGFHDETVVQGKRKKGQSNPSPEFIQSQTAAAYLTNFYRKVRGVVRSGWQLKAGNQSAYNAWYSDNYPWVINGATAPAIDPEYGSFNITRGVITPAGETAPFAADASDNEITGSLSELIIDETQNAADPTFFLVLNQTTGAVFNATIANRAGLDSFTLSPYVGFMGAGDIITVWSYQIGNGGNEYEGKFSNSLNETITVAA